MLLGFLSCAPQDSAVSDALTNLARKRVEEGLYRGPGLLHPERGIAAREQPVARTEDVLAQRNVLARDTGLHCGIAASPRVKSEPGPPMTLGGAAAAGVRLIVWCKSCRRRVEPAPAEMATRYGAETRVLQWRDRLVCSGCGGRQVDMVVTGERRAER
jgi:hypothetical protein